MTGGYITIKPGSNIALDAETAEQLEPNGHLKDHDSMSENTTVTTTHSSTASTGHGPRRRWFWALVIAGGMAIASSASAIALSVVNRPVVIHEVLAGVGPTRTNATPNQVGVPVAQSLTLGQAQSKVPFHLQVVSNPLAQLDNVSYHPPITSVNGHPITTSRPAIELDYTFEGVPLYLVEQQDYDLAQPLTLVVSGSGWNVTSIEGSQYAVFMTPNGERYSSIVWKDLGRSDNAARTRRHGCWARQPDCCDYLGEHQVGGLRRVL